MENRVKTNDFSHLSSIGQFTVTCFNVTFVTHLLQKLPVVLFRHIFENLLTYILIGFVAMLISSGFSDSVFQSYRNSKIRRHFGCKSRAGRRFSLCLSLFLSLVSMEIREKTPGRYTTNE